MKQPAYKNKKLRLLVGVGVPLGALILALTFFFLKSTPPCIFYELTGLYCVGCGSGRALLALLHGRLYAAFRYQPLLMISLPFVSYYVAKVYISFVFGRDLLPFPKIRSSAFGISLLVIILAYWILRNIPVFPFTLLAPTAV